MKKMESMQRWSAVEGPLGRVFGAPPGDSSSNQSCQSQGGGSRAERRVERRHRSGKETGNRKKAGAAAVHGGKEGAGGDLEGKAGPRLWQGLLGHPKDLRSKYNRKFEKAGVSNLQSTGCMWLSVAVNAG
ncbi:hypothetical protein HJG60_009487 [Phyllostomus discolor]|uniref:Uncharacterized protein n=1 Tax=Phyllostomus discolor TaxID=89673 RepID=A0A833YIK7_9CHIR|nr:hypothetical protein HJG60_009487 [Phyllostomus discolor]